MSITQNNPGPPELGRVRTLGNSFVRSNDGGTSTYFLLTMLALVDFLSGVALRARRRAPVTSGPAPAPVSTKGARAPSGVAAETRFVPEPAPSVPAAAAVAESVLLDRPQPKIQRPESQKPEVRPNAPPPEIVRAPSPEVVIVLNLPDAASPKQLGLGQDGRRLGLFVQAIEYKE